MSSEIKKIFNYCYQDIKTSKQYKEYLSEFVEKKKILLKELNERQQEILIRLTDLSAEMECEMEDASFTEGFKVGIRLALEAFQNKT